MRFKRLSRSDVIANSITIDAADDVTDKTGRELFYFINSFSISDDTVPT